MNRDIRRLEELDWWGRTNMRCDQLAKAHQLNIVNANPRPLPFKGQFPMENVRSFVKGGKLTGMEKQDLHDVIAFNGTMDHWVKREMVTETTVLLVHCDAVGDAIEKLTLAKRKWMIKHVLENCGMGKTLCGWNIHQDVLFQEEDAQHALQCAHHSNGEGKTKMLTALKEKMEEMDTGHEM